MGMYTELIFGAELKQDTPELAINALKYMCGMAEKPTEVPAHAFFDEKEDMFWQWFGNGSYYFAICNGLRKMWLDDISKTWRISVRCNIKNYGGEIEAFLDWIRPHIEKGSGGRDFYAIVCYEEQAEPNIHYLD